MEGVLNQVHGKGFVEELAHVGKVKTGTKGGALVGEASPGWGEDTSSALLLQLLGHWEATPPRKSWYLEMLEACSW